MKKDRNNDYTILWNEKSEIFTFDESKFKRSNRVNQQKKSQN